MDDNQIKSFHKALLAAFPSRAALARMVRFGLSENLASVADGNNLSDVAFALIEWAEAHDRLDALLDAAREDNPTNASLRTFADAYRTGAPSPAPSTNSAPTEHPMTRLREVLVALFPSPRQARIVAADAGIDTRTIDFNGSALEVWASVLEECSKSDRRGALLAAARAQYPTNPELRALGDL